jgi:hypothetical protein
MKKLNGLTNISILTLLLAFVIPSWSIYGMVQDGNSSDLVNDAQQTVNNEFQIDNASTDPVTNQGVDQPEQLEPMPQLLIDLLEHSTIIDSDTSHTNKDCIVDASAEDSIVQPFNKNFANSLKLTYIYRTFYYMIEFTLGKIPSPLLK